MKKLVIAGLMTAGLAIGAFGQGSINVSDGNSIGGLSSGTAGNYYSGTYGLEVLYLNAAAVPAGINGAANTDAYAALGTSGFTSAKIYANQTITAANVVCSRWVNWILLGLALPVVPLSSLWLPGITAPLTGPLRFWFPMLSPV